MEWFVHVVSVRDSPSLARFLSFCRFPFAELTCICFVCVKQWFSLLIINSTTMLNTIKIKKSKS